MQYNFASVFPYGQRLHTHVAGGRSVSAGVGREPLSRVLKTALEPPMKTLFVVWGQQLIFQNAVVAGYCAATCSRDRGAVEGKGWAGRYMAV